MWQTSTHTSPLSKNWNMFQLHFPQDEARSKSKCSWTYSNHINAWLTGRDSFRMINSLGQSTPWVSLYTVPQRWLNTWELPSLLRKRAKCLRNSKLDQALDQIKNILTTNSHFRRALILTKQCRATGWKQMHLNMGKDQAFYKPCLTHCNYVCIQPSKTGARPWICLQKLQPLCVQQIRKTSSPQQTCGNPVNQNPLEVIFKKLLSRETPTLWQMHMCLQKHQHNLVCTCTRFRASYDHEVVMLMRMPKVYLL